MSKFFWGIDVGKSSLKAVKLEKGKTQLQVVDIELIEFDQQGDEDVDRDEEVREALSRLKSRKKMRGDSVFLSIPGHGTFNRTVSLPPVDAKQIPEMVRWEAQQQIPFPIDEVIWDWQKIDNEEDFGEVEVNLFAVKKEVINNFIAMLEGIGIDADGIQIAPLALFNFIAYDQQPDGAVVAIDMGAEYSDLVVLNGTRIWIRNLQIAGNDITRAVQGKFQIPFGEAEKLKLKAAKSKHANKIFQVMKPILKDLVGEIHRSVGYYKSQNPDVRFDKVLLMGNGTKLVGFKRFFRDNLSDYKIELIKGLKRISVSNRVNVNLLSQNIASFGIALGLAVQAAGEALNNVVLIPEEKKQAEALKKKKPIFIVALLILAGVVWWKYGQSSAAMAEVKRQQKEAQKQVKAMKDIKKEWDAAKAWGSLLVDVDSIGQMASYRQQWADAVAAIYSVVPDANNRVRSAELEKDKDMLWLYDLKLVGETETRSFKVDDKGRPAPPPGTIWKMKGSLGVCLVASKLEDQTADTARIDRDVVAKLIEKLKPLGVSVKVERNPKADYYESRVPAGLCSTRPPWQRVGIPPAEEWGPYFCSVVEITLVFNEVKDPRLAAAK